MVTMPEIISATLFVVTVIGGVVIVLAGMWQRARTLEMAHRERLAMIERGLMPSPERDPEAFERSLSTRPASSPRAMAAGIVTISVGLGLALLLSVAARVPNVGLGVGGAIALLGAGFVVNALLAGTRKD